MARKKKHHKTRYTPKLTAAELRSYKKAKRALLSHYYSKAKGAK